VITNHFSRDYAETLSRVTNSFIFVSERRGDYTFLSSNMEFFGYDVPKDNWSPDSMFLEHRIHPEDLPVFQNLLAQMYDEYLPCMTVEKQKDYTQTFEFRALNRDKEWIRVISRHQILDFNSRGEPIELGVIDISPDQTPQAQVRATLTNAKTGEVIPFTVDRPAENELSKREEEILSLIGLGMYSKEISDRLSISLNTVNNHRQNIRKTMIVSYMAEAIKPFTLSL
jgi:DNA-binding CsgD family transcriptional regulator